MIIATLFTVTTNDIRKTWTETGHFVTGNDPKTIRIPSVVIWIAAERKAFTRCVLTDINTNHNYNNHLYNKKNWYRG